MNRLMLNYTMSCTHMAAYENSKSNVSSQSVCLQMSQTWPTRPVPARRAEKKGADSAGMVAENRSGQMGQC